MLDSLLDEHSFSSSKFQPSKLLSVILSMKIPLENLELFDWIILAC